MINLNRMLYGLYSRLRYANYYRAIDRGMKVGTNFFRQNSIYDKNYPWLINIGDNVNVTVTHSTILTHDESMKKHMNYTKMGVVTIEDNVFIGFNSTILPGVHIGKNSIIAAGSLITHDVEENTVVAGVPARKIKTIHDFLENNYSELNNPETLILKQSEITNEVKERIYIQLKHRKGFVR